MKPATYESLPDLVEQLVDRWNDLVEQRDDDDPQPPGEAEFVGLLFRASEQAWRLNRARR